MRRAKVQLAQHLSHMPNEDSNGRPVIKVNTSLPSGEINSFYMDIKDLDKTIIEIATGTVDPNHPNPDKITYGDDIAFDVQDGIHKSVLWNGRTIRQRGYSFDQNAPLR